MAPRPKPLKERLQNYHLDPTKGCWIWLGTPSQKRYKQIQIGDRLVGVHRVSYEFYKGPIPEGMQIDHQCDTPPCINPDHLILATPRDNTLRGNTTSGINSRKTHCIHGHEFTDDNTYYRPDGRGKACRVCLNNASKRYQERQRAMVLNGEVA